MDPATLALIAGGIQGAAGIGQTAIGLVQRYRAQKKLNRLEDPKMELPSSVVQMVDLARRRAGGDMPGLDIMKDELGATTARGLTNVTRAARTSGDVMSATKDLYAEQLRGVRGLDIASAQYRADREKELMGAYGQQAGYEQRMFDVNQLMPYQRRLQQYMAEGEIGGQNVAAGIGTIGSAGANTLENYMRAQMYQKWME